MRDRSFILVVAVLGVLFLGAAGVYVYDSSRDDVIAEGVRVAEIDLGGLSPEQARSKLESQLRAQLRQPVVARRDGKAFTLTARRARVGVDTQAMVDEALERSRQGSIFARTYRSIRGESLNERIEPRVTYSSRAVDVFVTRVRRALNRKPVDASLSFAAGGIAEVAGQPGLAVDVGALRNAVQDRLTARGGNRDVRIGARSLRPKVTKANLADKYPQLIIVNRGGFELRFYRKLSLVKSYRIAVGQAGLETPAGMYSVQNKAVNPAWSVPNSDWAGELAGQVIPGGTPQNPLKARWLGIYAGAGIHGTDAVGSLGTAASHGCIRMAIPDVIELYDQVPVQTPVYIA